MSIAAIVPFIPSYLGFHREAPITKGILPRAYDIIQYKGKWWRVDLVVWPEDAGEVHLYLSPMHSAPTHITEAVLDQGLGGVLPGPFIKAEPK
jgi:hypothetical protein